MPLKELEIMKDIEALQEKLKLRGQNKYARKLKRLLSYMSLEMEVEDDSIN
jgi:hypothetical protein